MWGRYSAFAVTLGINEELKKEIYEKIIGNQHIHFSDKEMIKKWQQM